MPLKGRAIRCKSSLVPRCGLSAAIPHAETFISKKVLRPKRGGGSPSLRMTLYHSSCRGRRHPAFTTSWRDGRLPLFTASWRDREHPLLTASWRDGRHPVFTTLSITHHLSLSFTNSPFRPGCCEKPGKPSLREVWEAEAERSKPPQAPLPLGLV